MSTSGGNTAAGVTTVAAGSGITVTDPSGPTATVAAVSTSYASANLAADVAVAANGSSTIFTTPNLDAGTLYLVTAAVVVANGGATAGAVSLQIEDDTAVATLTGQAAAEAELPALTGGAVYLGVSIVANVSQFGNLIVYVYSTVAATVKATTPTLGLAHASGYYLQRIR